MRLDLACILALVVAAQTGCYRTHYERFSAMRSDSDSGLPVQVTGWQSFFLYGWAPAERRIDARDRCGGADKIHSIETRRTFLEGFVAAFAGYYINIYSPYDGAVFCTEQPPAKASS
jgi:hypothetical protein